MSESMIERVARALAHSYGSQMTGPGRHKASDEIGWRPDGGHIDEYVERHWRDHQHAATFAIEVMRLPTIEMVMAGAKSTYGKERELADEYTAMIDEALKP